jgi:CheY-like chemotaxis protein
MEASDCHILVVDDDDVERESIADLLVEEGYWVSIARDGLEALQRIKENPDINLVLLDMSMPVMSGARFLEEISKCSDLTALKVLVVSGRDFQSDFARPETDAESTPFLKKPVAPEALRLSVAARLNLLQPRI